MKQAASTTWQRVAKLAELSAQRPCAASLDGVELVLVQTADGVRELVRKWGVTSVFRKHSSSIRQ